MLNYTQYSYDVNISFKKTCVSLIFKQISWYNERMREREIKEFVSPL
jgi:hypothetical protein